MEFETPMRPQVSNIESSHEQATVATIASQGLPEDNIELSNLDIVTSRGGRESELPPVDVGRGAWGYLAGAFIIEAIVWGTKFIPCPSVYLMCIK